MLKSLLLRGLALFAAATLLIACGNDGGVSTGPGAKPREAKYEVTGNYTGALTVIYTAKGGGTASVDITSLPWVRDVTPDTNVGAVALAAEHIGGALGLAGQTVTIKIIVGGKVVKTQSETAPASGRISVPVVVWQF
jgi:hypothetical protein